MTNEIVRSVIINVPIDDLWRALTTAKEFGKWFGAELRGPFEPGRVTYGVMTLTGLEGSAFWMRIEAMEAPYLFRFSWPYDEKISPDDEELDTKITQVSFLLESLDNRTKLTIHETGFKKLPPSKKLQVFRNNTNGWDFQTERLIAHVT